MMKINKFLEEAEKYCANQKEVSKKVKGKGKNVKEMNVRKLHGNVVPNGKPTKSSSFKTK
jgi:hypothetical protein